VKTAAVAVEATDEFQVAAERTGRLAEVPQTRDPVAELAGLRRVAAEVVASGPGVRLEVGERLVLARQRLDQRDQHDVLQHVGEVAGVEGVAVVQA
jgi:hypothetical protein